MKITKIPGLGSRGIYIDDVDLNHISDEEWLEIGHLYMQNLVTILRNVTVTKERYPELMAKWDWASRGDNLGVTQEGNPDLMQVQKAAWGELGYKP